MKSHFLLTLAVSASPCCSPPVSCYLLLSLMHNVYTKLLFGADVARNKFEADPFFGRRFFFPLNLQDADQEAAAAGVSCLAAIGEVWSEFFVGCPYGWKSKNRGKTSKMDGENNGKPYFLYG